MPLNILKTSFFNGKSIDEELSIYFRSVKLSTYEYFMFLARMIYADILLRLI